MGSELGSQPMGIRTIGLNDIMCHIIVISVDVIDRDAKAIGGSPGEDSIVGYGVIEQGSCARWQSIISWPITLSLLKAPQVSMTESIC